MGEDRRSGALELLLVTPLGQDQILSGHRRALQRRSRGLKTVLVLVNVCMCLAVLTWSKPLHMSSTDQHLFVELFAGGILALVCDLRALQAVGIWVALRGRKHQRAVLGTLGRVMLVPWACIFVWVFLTTTRAINPTEGELGVIFAVWFAVGVVNDLIIGGHARARLGDGLRYWVVAGKAAWDRERFWTTSASAARAAVI